MNPLVASVIRTLVPNIVTQISAWLLLANMPLLPTTVPLVSAVVGFILFAGYYVGVRVIEQQWPSFGVLLGLPKSPDTYSKETVTAAEPAAPTKGAEAIVIPATPASADAPAPASADVIAPEIGLGAAVAP